MAVQSYKWLGKAIKRVEDPRFITGQGRYIDDINLPGLCTAYLLRSPHAHARIKKINVEQAKKIPGVIAVVTGRELMERFNPLPNFGHPDVVQYPLAVDKVRYVGEGVAAIIATDKYVAADACEAIEVEYEPLPAVTDPEKAMREDAPLIHEKLGSNVVFSKVMSFGEFEKDFSEAEYVVEEKLRWNRSSAQPIETTGAVASYDAGTGRLTIWCNSLNFTNFIWMFANSLKIPSNKLVLVPVNAGGSFGSKFFAHKVPCLAGMLSIMTGRPVKFIEERRDHLLNSDHHGSDRIYDAALAFDSDGTFRALKVKVIDDYGAYFQFGVGTHGNSLAQVVGPYRIKSVKYELYAVLTNKCQQGAYRGFGSEVTNWMVDRLAESAAKKLGLDPIEIKRKNFIRPDEFPYKIPTGNIYDSGNYQAVLDKALEISKYHEWRRKQEELRKQGRYIGIGVAPCQERSVFSATEFWFWFDQPAAPVTSTPESVTVSIDAMGKFTITIYSQAMWGNSPETVVAQLVAEEFGVDPYDVSVVYQDTSRAVPATGPGGSRFSVMIAGAIRGASKRLKEKLLRVAANILEVSVDDLELKDGKVVVKGTDRGKTIAELAALIHMFKHNYLPEDIESGLERTYTYDHPYTTMPSPDRKDLGVFYPIMAHACHVVVVEVDVETGQVKFLDYTAVHDVGTIINPKTLEGMIVGGIAQGIGTSLYEQHTYNEDGQPLNASLMDYLIPSSLEVPDEVKVDHVMTPSPYTAFGIKGGGEGGRMIAPAAIVDAIEDALSPFNVKINEVPITPEKIVQLIKKAQQK